MHGYYLGFLRPETQAVLLYLAAAYMILALPLYLLYPFNAPHISKGRVAFGGIMRYFRERDFGKREKIVALFILVKFFYISQPLQPEAMIIDYIYPLSLSLLFFIDTAAYLSAIQLRIQPVLPLGCKRFHKRREFHTIAQNFSNTSDCHFCVGNACAWHQVQQPHKQRHSGKRPVQIRKTPRLRFKKRRVVADRSARAQLWLVCQHGSVELFVYVKYMFVPGLF